MTTERHVGTGGPVPPLTRADVELLLSKVERSSEIDVSFQNLQHINLSYLDLRGANLRGTNLQGANLRGTNLSETDLHEANLSEADLDGADLSRAHLGDHEANRVNLHHAKLSYATLRDLDLHGFDLTELDLQNADLNGTDLRDAVLLGADLRGADLSTSQLHGPELHGATLSRIELCDNRSKQTHRVISPRKRLTAVEPSLVQEGLSLIPEQGVKQSKKMLSDREAYIFGEHALLTDADLVKIRRLFPQGFNFVMARQFFDAWLLQSEGAYSEREINAMWIGFAHQICDLYHRGEAET